MNEKKELTGSMQTDLISSIKDSDEVSESSSSDTESFVLEKIKD